jgi:AraC-like DNA-binding protein
LPNQRLNGWLQNVLKQTTKQTNMQPLFEIQNGRSISLQAGLPAGYRGIILQGAVSASIQTSSEMIVLQNFIRTDFAIQLGIYKFLNLVRSILRPPPFPTVSLLALKNDLNATVNGIGTLVLKKGQFSIIHFNDENLLTDFEIGREYQLLEISCSGEMLKQALPHFPGLAEQFIKAGSYPNASLLSAPRAAGANALDLVQDLLNSPFDPGVNEIYFEYKVREYLLLLLVESYSSEKSKILLTREQKEKILALKLRMEQDPVAKFRITSLAREMEMNEMKLKIAFKELVGKNIFEFHIDQRMKEALRLLKYSDFSTKEIASMVGYEFVTNFIIRFRKHYGFPPSVARKKR